MMVVVRVGRRCNQIKHIGTAIACVAVVVVQDRRRHRSEVLALGSGNKGHATKVDRRRGINSGIDKPNYK